jgi:acyl-CoA thioesterase-2
VGRTWCGSTALIAGGDIFRATNAQGAGPRLFGGLIAAQALAAAGATVESGRSLNTGRVTASQDDVPIFEMLA